MTRDSGANKRTGRKAKTLAVCAMAALASLVATVPASAMPVGDGVRAGKNIPVVHNLDFVAASGYTEGEKLTVDVYRGEKRIEPTPSGRPVPPPSRSTTARRVPRRRGTAGTTLPPTSGPATASSSPTPPAAPTRSSSTT